MEFCHSFGKDSSLVVIETEQENNYLKQWLIKHGMIRDSNGVSELPLIPKTVEYRTGRSPLF